MRIYPRVFLMLKSAGHVPDKAIEIIVAAKDGEIFAIEWIRSVRAEVGRH